MPITFSSAVKPGAPAVVDTTLATSMGASSMGLGFTTTVDGTALPGAMYLGNPRAPTIKFETDANLSTPAPSPPPPVPSDPPADAPAPTP